jgi:hypothetical protein
MVAERAGKIIYGSGATEEGVRDEKDDGGMAK